MKKLLHLISFLVGCGLYWSQPLMAQQNVLINGDFETQFPNRPPSQELNIKALDARFPYIDELPSWSVPNHITNPYSYDVNATFMANNGNYTVNPQQSGNYFSGNGPGPFSPHSGGGCIGLKRHTYNSLAADGLLMQQVSLVAGHSYQVTYWARKLNYSNYKCKMAFSVVNSSSVPTFDGNTSVNSIVPNPYAIISSDYITSTDTWVQVTGTFIAQAPDSNSNTWLILGFDRSLGVYDASLYNPISADYYNYGIDDVSLIDMGCATSSIQITVEVNGAPILEGSEVCRFQIITFTGNVTGSLAGSLKWEVVNRSAPNDYKYSIGPNANQYRIITQIPLNDRPRYANFQIKASGTDLCGQMFDSYYYLTSIFSDSNGAICPDPGSELFIESPTDTQQDALLASASSQLEIFPMPASNELTVYLSDNNKTLSHVQLYNSQGNAIQCSSIKFKSSIRFNVGEVPPGLYIIRATLASGNILTTHISIQR